MLLYIQFHPLEIMYSSLNYFSELRYIFSEQHDYHVSEHKCIFSESTFGPNTWPTEWTQLLSIRCNI